MHNTDIKYEKPNILGGGFPCPRCQNKIYATPQQLFAGSISCSVCNLQLHVNMEQSKETLSKLKEFGNEYPAEAAKQSAKIPRQKVQSPVHQKTIDLGQFVKNNRIKYMYKDESRLMRLLNKYFYGGRKDSKFMDYYATVGKTRLVYVPRKWWDKATEEEKVILLRHELIHMKQIEKYGQFLFFFQYICLPFRRAKFEKDAYEETLRARHEYWGKQSITSSKFREWVINQITSSSYLWMRPSTRRINHWYDDALQKILG